MRALPRTIAALFVLLASAVVAQAQEWVAAQVAQPAHYTLDAQTWTEIAPGLAIPNSAWVQTGRRGRVILQRGAETIQFRPSTVAAIVSRAGGLTDVRQKTGSLLLDLETRATRHATVETPFLAAVVKGTRFEVGVSRRGATLRVEQGLVEATHLARGEQVDVRPGQSVEVTPDASQPLSVTGAGPKAPVVRVAPVAPSVVPAVTPREAERAQSAGPDAPAFGAAATPEPAPERASEREGDGRGGEISASANQGGLLNASRQDVSFGAGGAADVPPISTGAPGALPLAAPQGPQPGQGNGDNGGEDEESDEGDADVDTNVGNDDDDGTDHEDDDGGDTDDDDDDDGGDDDNDDDD